MATIKPNGAVIGEQLAAELGGAQVVAEPDGTLTVTGQGVTEAKALAALSAHTPDPDYGVPDEDRQLRVLRTKAREVAAGTGTFTPDQVQKILARLVLRATR